MHELFKCAKLRNTISAKRYFLKNNNTSVVNNKLQLRTKTPMLSARINLSSSPQLAWWANIVRHAPMTFSSPAALRRAHETTSVAPATKEVRLETTRWWAAWCLFKSRNRIWWLTLVGDTKGPRESFSLWCFSSIQCRSCEQRFFLIKSSW